MKMRKRVLVVPWSIEPTKISEGCIVRRKRGGLRRKAKSPVYRIIKASMRSGGTENMAIIKRREGHVK